VRDTIAKFGGVVKGSAFQGQITGKSTLPSFEQPILNVKLRGDVRQVSQFQTHMGGGMFSVGIGGSITGRGADLLLVDDFVKNAEEAESSSTLDAIWDWFISTAYTRLEPNASVIILATRWNMHDLIGRVMEYSKTSDKKWQVITLPALALEGDILGREPGEALWPERYPVSELDEKRAILGTYFWQALYQQNPVKKEDASASPEDIKYVDILPHPSHMRHLRSWDTGATEGGGDFTVGVKWGIQGRVGENPSFYIQDIARGQWGNTKMEKIIRETAEADGHDCTIVLEQEPGSSGKNYALYLAETVLKGFKVTVKSANTNKWLKAQPFLAALENGQVYAKRAGWNLDLEGEILTFPSGSHDDIIDSASIGFNELVSNKHKSPLWGRNQGSERKLHNYVTSVHGNQPISGATFGRRS
jgi:predicted phage terminase large subunit-like protein